MTGVATWPPEDPDYTSQSQSGTSYPLGLDAAIKAGKRPMNMFAPHEQTVGSPAPDMTIRIEAGAILVDNTLTEIAAQTVSGFTTPSAGQHRIDRVVLNPRTGVCSRVAGTAVTGSPSAVAPAITAGSLPVCQVLITDADTAIANSMITDERMFNPLAATSFGTESTTTGGTSIDFTGIPNDVNEVTVHYTGLSGSGTSPLMLQIGDSGGLENTGYGGGSSDGAGVAANSAGYLLERTATAARSRYGHVSLRRADTSSGTKWTAIHNTSLDTGYLYAGGGSKTLSAALDRVRLTTSGGTDTFDVNGGVNVTWSR